MTGLGDRVPGRVKGREDAGVTPRFAGWLESRVVN